MEWGITLTVDSLLLLCVLLTPNIDCNHDNKEKLAINCCCNN